MLDVHGVCEKPLGIVMERATGGTLTNLLANSDDNRAAPGVDVLTRLKVGGATCSQWCTTRS